MTLSEVVVLIPGHSLEDFPTELGDKPAASLLNSFSVAWHPALIAMAGSLPKWHRADEPPDQFENRVYFVPTACDSQVPRSWIKRAREAGAIVVSGLDQREPMIRTALAPLIRQDDETPQLADDVDIDAEMETDPELVRDFHALGTCWVLFELLTRHMHHFTSHDEVYFEKTVVAAAQAVLDGDNERAADRLRACFDLLLEARERFYPVDAYLLDLCLLTPDLAGKPLRNALDGPNPVNLLLKGADAVEISEKHPTTIRRMAECWASETADIVGGDNRELPVPLVPLQSVLWDLASGRDVFRRLFGREPSTWGRRRFGLSLMQPQLLLKSGFHSGLHFLLDDGIYPDREQSRMRWEGCDSSALDAYSRIPLAADSASTWLRFPHRLSETMQSDSVAALILARWPEVKCPFFGDLQRMQKYAPVLGRFVTFNEYFLHTDDPGGIWGTERYEYLSPFFVQAVARRQANPISRYQKHFERMARFESASWQSAISAALLSRPVNDSDADAVQKSLEDAGPDVFDVLPEVTSDPAATIAAAEAALDKFARKSGSLLRQIVTHGAEAQAGWLCVNPLSFPRTVVVDLPDARHAPSLGAPVKGVQFDGVRKQAIIELPPAGYAWIADAPGGRSMSPPQVPLAEANHLQNEFFEVFINESSGGIARFKRHGRSPNRLSQHLSFRYPREQTVRRPAEGDKPPEEFTTWYSDIRCTSSEVTCTGPALGEIVTTGELLDPNSGVRLANFRQTFRVWRFRPFLEVEIELSEIAKTPEGDPWSTFYGSRFAWSDSTAALSQSVLGAAQTIPMERIESPDFIEIATSDEERTTILPLGLPFHRKTGPRMLDSILVVEGEAARRFQFVIGLDQHYPMQAAQGQLSPIVAIPTEAGPPVNGRTGWFYHVNSNCVQVTHLSGLLNEPLDPVHAVAAVLEAAADGDPSEDGSEVTAVGAVAGGAVAGGTARAFEKSPSDRRGFALRLQETEGRYQMVHVELFRNPTNARIRDFRGQTVTDLSPSGDGVLVDLSPFSVVEVEVFFD